jgi:small multidrug resistance family-3 protein
VTLSQELLFWSILFISAVFEVGGDALIRQGLKARGLLFIIPGFLILGTYGVILNLLSGPQWASKWVDLSLFKSIGVEVTFSMLLGVYVAVFAMVSIFGSALFSRERVALSTWMGGGIVLLGGLVIRYCRF